MSTSPLGLRRKALFDELGSRLAPLGFVPRYSMQAFRRRYPWGRDSIHLAFIQGGSRLQSAVDVAIRFDAVEKLIDPFRPWLTDRAKRDMFTIGAELGNVAGTGYRTFEVGEDIGRTADEMMVLIGAVGLPYLQELADPEAAFDVLVRDDRVGRLHSPMADHRAFAACALLVVLGRGHELPDLVAKKLQILNPDEFGPMARQFPAFAQAMIERGRH